MRLLTFLALATLVAVGGCRRRRAGDACDTAGRFVCDDGTTALYCSSAGWIAVPCRGPGGCRAGDGGAPQCDDTRATAGEACMAEGSHACVPEGDAALVCSGGEWKTWRACKGERRCAVSGDEVACDDTIGDVGDRCTDGTAGACSADHATLLECQSGELAPRASCRGPKGCGVDEATKTLTCDHAVAAAGDPCAAPGERTCSVDGKSELACTKERQWTKARECKGKPCEMHPGELPRCS